MEDSVQLRVDSLRLLQDWSKWLISLEGLICAGLWTKLTDKSTLVDKVPPSPLLYLGWMMFWASIIAAAVLLISIASFVRRAAVSGESDWKWVKILVAVEYAFFLGGLFCLALRIADQFWSAS